MKSIYEQLNEALTGGECALFLPDTTSSRSMLSRWSGETGVKYITFKFEGDMFVGFRQRLAERELNQ